VWLGLGQLVHGPRDLVWALFAPLAQGTIRTLSERAVYYELAWSFCLLLTFWLLLRYVESGDRRFFIAQCVTFVLGFFCSGAERGVPGDRGRLCDCCRKGSRPQAV